MAIIPDDVIADIRTRVDIVAVIGQHVQLRKAGRNWKGLCPFHGEKTPSFNVMPDKGFFNCFGCQKKGDAITFVMEYSGKTFVEAVEELAARTGIVIPRVEESPELKRARSERQSMLAINRVATEFFRDALLHSPRGAAARAYLEQRGIADEVSEKFRLGYAPDDWQALRDHLTSQSVDIDLAVRVGLLKRQPDSGRVYDMFRDRLVCPIVVPGGEVVGFSARVIAADAPTEDGYVAAKYINSPESTVYKKGRLLFGLAQAREGLSSQKQAVLVEGNFDVISMHQAGLTQTVAPLGTALTPEQVEQLRRLTGEVVLCYDGDNAGKRATRAALELLVAADVPVRVIALPDGEDPDSLLRKEGAAKFTERVKRAQGGIEFFCFEVWGRSRGDADARSRAIDDAARVLAKVANPTKRDLILGTLATAMEVAPDVMRRALARAGQNADSAARQGHSGHPNTPHYSSNSPAPTPTEQPVASARPAVPTKPPPVEEVELVTLFADHPELLSTVEADKAFSLLTDTRLRAICSAARAGQTIVELATTLLPEATAALVLSGQYAAESSFGTGSGTRGGGGPQSPLSRLVELTKNLQQRSLGSRLAELNSRIAEAQRQGNSELARQLTVELLTSRK